MNPHGGSIALGEPYGAAGARLTTTALTTLRHDDLTTALVTVVAAGGQGMAMLLERTAWTSKAPMSAGRRHASRALVLGTTYLTNDERVAPPFLH